MKKLLGLLFATVMALATTAALTGCAEKAAPSSSQPAPPPASSSSAPAARQTTLTINFSNTSGYMFNEIYISPTAANDWGEDLLGSTMILKSGGSLELEIPAYDFDNYDILVTDEDQDEYEFTRVPLKNGSEVAIFFDESGLAAEVYDARGNLTDTVFGTLNGEDAGGGTGGGTTDADATGWIEFSLANGTSHITFQEVYFMPQGTTNEADIGYNHIASVAPLESGEYAAIGVDDHTLFDIIMLAEGGSEWYFTGVYLAADCLVYPTNHNGAGLTVEYADGTSTDYVGELYT